LANDDIEKRFQILILAEMVIEAGILPGRYADMFSGLFNPKLHKLLTQV
jgi:hypothetical protein